MKRIIGIITGVIGSILTAWVIAVISGIGMSAESVNVIGGADAPTLIFLFGKGGLKSVLIAFLAGLLLIIISYNLLFKKKK